jgi:hypothetical protein
MLELQLIINALFLAEFQFGKYLIQFPTLYVSISYSAQLEHFKHVVCT